MPRPATQFGELRRLFFGRFLDNDLIALEGDANSILAGVLGLLAAQGLFLPFFEFLQFSSMPLVAQPWDLRDLAALPHKALHIGLSLTVIGLVSVLEWDALLLDRRDIGVLRPLPIRVKTLLAAKVAALAQFWMVFCLVVSALPAVLLPMIVLPAGREALLLRFIGAHAASVLAANAFIFLFVIALQSMLLLLLGYRLYRRVSPWVQGVLLALLLGGFFLALGMPFDVEESAVLRLLPPVWFVGLYQALLGWPHEMFRELAWRGVMALLGTGLVALAAYSLSYRRIVAQSFEALEAPVSTRRAWQWGWLNRRLLTSPAQRASFHFVLATMLRSRTHRMLVLGWFGAGGALVFHGIAGFAASGARDWWRSPGGPLLPAAAILWLFLIAGLRYSFTVPAELRANWMFQTAGALDVHQLMMGVRKAVLPAAILPLAAVLLPLHAFAWGWPLAAFHIAYHATIAWLLAECLLIGFDKLPFSCAYVAGKADLKSRWWLFVLAYFCYAATVTAVEKLMFGYPERWAVFFAAAAAAEIGLNAWRRRLDGEAVLEFNARPDPAVQTLELA